MSATEYTDEDVQAAALAVFSFEQCDRRQQLDVEGNWASRLNESDQQEYRDLTRTVLDAAAPAIVARERRRAEAAEQRADAFEAALTEEREMAHETIRALQAKVDRLTEAVILTRQPGYTDEDAKCPLPGCGSPLYLIRSWSIPVADTLGAAIGEHDAVSDGWEIVCEENDHRVDSGGSETDGRSALIGYRRAQSLGGLR